MSDITLEVNGIRYSGFTDAAVTNSIESFASQFTFAATAKDAFDFSTGNFGTIQNDLKVQDEVKVYIGDDLVSTGHIEDLNLSYTPDSHGIVVKGRDKAGDLIDSSIIQKSYSQTFFISLVKAVLKDNGYADIKISNKTTSLLKLENVGAVKTEKGDTIASFIDRYAKKLQVLITTDESGDLVVIREGSELSTGSIRAKMNSATNNVLAGSLSISTTERYRYIEMYSQGSNDSFTSSSVSQSGISIDKIIRSPRRKRISMTTASEDATLGDMAKWNVNIRKARGQRYNCTVQGFHADPESKKLLWLPNTLVTVDDDRCQISGQFLIQGVSYRYSNEGSFTDLSIVEKGAFTVGGLPFAKGSSLGGDLIKDAGVGVVDNITRVATGGIDSSAFFDI